MRFPDLLPAERVRTDLAAADKMQFIGQLADLLATAGDADGVVGALRAREKLGSTGLGKGVAIPHGRSPAIREARAAFARLAEPLDWDAADGKPVDLVVALIVPTHFTDQHLELLAEFATLFSDPQLTAALRAAPDAHALHAELMKAGGG